MTFRVPGTEYDTDHDPSGVQWMAGNITARELTTEVPIEPGQTHRTTIQWHESARWEDVPTRPSKADAATVLDASCPADPDDWRVFAVVPAQVADGEHRPQGEAWTDLLCALALAAGRPNSNPTNPLYCGHDRLTLCADPADFTAEELSQLDAWGFADDGDGGFYSFRFGSA